MIEKLDLTHLKWNGINQAGSIGMLPKTELFRGNKRYYVKMSSYNEYHGVYGIEAVSEVIASRLAKILKINCVNYKLYDALVLKDNKKFRTNLCISKDYKETGEEVIPFGDFYNEYKYKNETTLDFIKRMNFTEEVYKMFIFDYIINNLDRHDANIEIRRNKMELAPLFDNGSSLYSTTSESNIKGFYYGEDMNVNNCIGSRSLITNLKSIDKRVEIGTLKKEHRQRLFRDLENVISRDRRDTIWKHILRRYVIARKICNFKSIQS